MSSSKLPEAEEGDVHYTVFVRLPFPRGDFVDPLLIDWDEQKDQELWRVLAANPRSGEIDWKLLATTFEVPLEFILQKAAFLYQMNLSGVREQIRRSGRTASISGVAQPQASISPSSVPKFGSLEDPRASTSLETSRRPPSALTVKVGDRQRKISQEGSSPSTPTVLSRPNTISRNPSASTITQSRTGRAGSRASGSRGSFSRAQFSQFRDTAYSKTHAGFTQQPDPAGEDSPSAVEPDSSSSSESASDEEGPPLRSQMLRRYSRFGQGRPEDTDDDDEGPAFLPQATREDRNGPHRQQASVSGSFLSSRRGPPYSHSHKGKERQPDAGPSKPPHAQRIESQSEASSTSEIASPADASQPTPANAILSPRRQAELAGLINAKSPPHSKRSGSEGTPSMGSSFSDLENASVTQSALEEEAASFLNKGGSRMSRLGWG